MSIDSVRTRIANCFVKSQDLTSFARPIRNALEAASSTLRFAESAPMIHARQIDALARVHRLLRARAPSASDPRQLALF